MKGISPIIATVMLVAFVISLGLLIFGWMSTLQKTTTESVTASTVSSVECASAKASIDTVYITGSTANAVIKNSGFKNLTLTGSQYINTAGTAVAAATTLPISLPVGSIQTISFSGGAISCATFSQVVITTSCGGVGDKFTSTPVCS